MFTVMQRSLDIRRGEDGGFELEVFNYLQCNKVA